MADAAALPLPDPGVHIPYTVVDQEPWQEMVGKRFIDGMLVHYTGPSGVQDQVFIPRAEYSPAMVDRILQDRLHTVESVASLGASPHPENLAAGA